MMLSAPDRSRAWAVGPCGEASRMRCAALEAAGVGLAALRTQKGHGRPGGLLHAARGHVLHIAWGSARAGRGGAAHEPTFGKIAAHMSSSSWGCAKSTSFCGRGSGKGSE
jgi:hypothetical protein